MLKEADYPDEDLQFLINGFRYGFDIGYAGPEDRADEAENRPITVGSKTELWNKVMKEVKLKRFTGPYCQIPFKNYIQSPIGLVPKGNDQTRLIFHLSYEFKSGKGSLNANTPSELCSVKYKDLDYAVLASLKMLNEKDPDHRILFYSKSDLKSAFRILGLCKKSFKWLIMRATDPATNITYFFADKALPFGSSISCSLFQKFSDSLRHLIEYRTGARLLVTNYLDDFLFIGESEQHSNWLVSEFLTLCEDISCPVSLDKTEWASTKIIFLGILLDGINHCLCVPMDKRYKAIHQIHWLLSKSKATIREIQSITGLLNFLSKAVIPGRTFSRMMYTKLKTVDKNGRKLKHFHHVKLSEEFKMDCNMWLTFLNRNDTKVFCRPFVDLNRFVTSKEIHFYTDASGKIGYGCSFKESWCHGKWSREFILNEKPSIRYLEMYALCAAIVTWAHKLTNTRVRIFCDNKGVCDAINDLSSGCKNCMILIRILVLNNMIFNRVFVKYVESKKNDLADALSRDKITEFKRLARKKFKINKLPDLVPSFMNPVEKIWVKS